MHLTVIRSVPDLDKYTPLSTHQSQTPASFSIPVLHFRNENNKLVLTKDQASLLPIFDDKTATSGVQGTNPGNEAVEVDGIDIWVTSENFILYNTSSSVGVTLPYTSITLHAIQHVPQGSGIYMQISLSPAASQTTNNEAYDDDDMLEVTVLPLPNEEDRTNTFFKALSDCANLHPDPDTGSTDDEMEDPIMFEGAIGYEGSARIEGFPGEGGWITAENVDHFQFDDAVDGEGDATTTILGPGAGTVRPREEGPCETENESGVNGGIEEAKWRRIE